MPNRTRSGINSGLDVLECLAAQEHACSLTEIAAALGMAKSSVHQLLGALLARGYVQRQAGQLYGVGVKAWEVGCKAGFVEIGRVAEPYMAELVRSVSEGVSLGLLDGTHTVCIQIAESPQAVRVHRFVGERNPAHCLSNGLALLATLSDEEVAQLLPRKLDKVTAKTIGTREELLAELGRVRQRGYAVCRGTWRLDVGGVAVAIRGADHRAVAGISIALPLDRLTPSRLQRLAAGLLASAAGIQRQLDRPALQMLAPAGRLVLRPLPAAGARHAPLRRPARRAAAGLGR
jgi:IclR family KDG regulon transcriptional repressor